LLELAQDLRLTENHRIEPAGDAEEVPDRLFAFAAEERAGRLRAELSVLDEPGPQTLCPAFLRRGVDLRTVAGGQDHGLPDSVQGENLGEGVLHVVAGKYDLFANFDRRRAMVQPEYVQR